MANKWRVYGSETVAAALSKEELPGFSRQVQVGPSEAALIIRSGILEEVITESRLSTSGIGDRLAGFFGRAASIEVIFADTSPFELVFFLGEATRVDQREELQSVGTATAISASLSGIAGTRDDVFGILETKAGSQTDTASVSIAALTADREPVNAQVRLTVRVDLDDVELLAKMLRGKAALAVWDIAALVRDELIAKVLVPKVARYRAEELRGNSALLNELDESTARELGNTFDLWGLRLENFSLLWGLTEQERADIEQTRGRREEEARDFAHQRYLREQDRKLEIDRTRLGNLHELKEAEARGDEQLKEILLVAEIDREQLMDGQRLDSAKIDAQIRSVELGIEREEANLRLDVEHQQADMQLDIQRREAQNRLEELEAQSRLEMSEMEQMVNLQSRRRAEKHIQSLEMRRLEIESDFARRRQDQESLFARRQQDVEMTRERMRMQEALIARGLDAGAADSSVLISMLEQATEQEYARTSDAKVQARSEADAARYSVENIREEQDRERAHQAEMTRLSAQMMEASKQIPVPGSVQPPFPAPAAPPLAQGPTINVTSGPAAPPPYQSASATCPSCSAPVQSAWKVCPQCGNGLAPDPQCPSCNQAVQPGWMACPFCGTQLVRDPACRGCGNPVDQGWRACPSCGIRLA